MPRLLLALLLCPSFAFAATLIGWEKPTTNVDGTALTDLAGYRIHWGPTTSLTGLTVVDITDPAATSYPLELPPGTWYVRMTAYTPTSFSQLTSAVGPIVVASLPPTCGASPAPESRQQTCPAPTIGNFTQTRASVSAPPPACWTPGEWLPTSAPAGICAGPAPTLVTAGPLSYTPSGTATAPSMTFVGYVAAGLPCGPETKVVAGVKYCHIDRSQTDLVNSTGDLTLSNLWTRAQ